MTPAGLDRVFFADSGSVSVEVALKMALQAQRGLGRPGRDPRARAARRLPRRHRRARWQSAIPSAGCTRCSPTCCRSRCSPRDRPPATTPTSTAWSGEVAALVAEHADELAAIICEPVLQGAGGMHVYDPSASPSCAGWPTSTASCSSSTRSRPASAAPASSSQPTHAGGRARHHVRRQGPDGRLPHPRRDAVHPRRRRRGLGERLWRLDARSDVHGQPARVRGRADANLALLADGRWRVDVARIEARLSAGSRGRSRPADGRRRAGARSRRRDPAREPVDIERATAAARQRGVWIRPFRDLVYTMPPYIAGDDDIDAICAALVEAAVA